MRVVLAGAMFAVVMSGCLGGSDKGATASLPLETGEDEGLEGTELQANRAPAANLTSDAGANGTASLNVTFTIQAFDADGDDLAWTLTLDNVTIGNGTSVAGGNTTAGNGTASTEGDTTAGNGTASSEGNATAGNATGTTLRATMTYEFAESGNHTVVLNVTDGTNSTLTNLTIAVQAGETVEAASAATEDAWVVFNADGTCDAKGEVGGGGVYVHERGTPPGTGFLLGDGTWVYEESNGIAGLQVGGPGEADLYIDCLTPDTLRF